jgi:hypothetical protein
LLYDDDSISISSCLEAPTAWLMRGWRIRIKRPAVGGIKFAPRRHIKKTSKNFHIIILERKPKLVVNRSEKLV